MWREDVSMIIGSTRKNTFTREIKQVVVQPPVSKEIVLTPIEQKLKSL